MSLNFYDQSSIQRGYGIEGLSIVNSISQSLQSHGCTITYGSTTHTFTILNSSAISNETIQAIFDQHSSPGYYWKPRLTTRDESGNMLWHLEESRRIDYSDLYEEMPISRLPVIGSDGAFIGSDTPSSLHTITPLPPHVEQMLENLLANIRGMAFQERSEVSQTFPSQEAIIPTPSQNVETTFQTKMDKMDPGPSIGHQI